MSARCEGKGWVSEGFGTSPWWNTERKEVRQLGLPRAADSDELFLLKIQKLSFTRIYPFLGDPKTMESILSTKYSKSMIIWAQPTKLPWPS
jgi:hypothetical protein